jgi:hypothetical protein
MSSRPKRLRGGCKQPNEDDDPAKEDAGGHNMAHHPENSPNFKMECEYQMATF